MLNLCHLESKMAASQNLLVFQEELLPCPPLPIPSTPAHPSMHQSWGMLSGFLYVSRQLMAPPSPSNPLHPPQSSVGIFGIPNLAPWPRCTRSSQMAAAACLVRRRMHRGEGRKTRNNELGLKAHPGLASFVQPDAGYK